ncbi:heme-degrading domain-containing protein [Fibrella aquatilis]|uniref:UPF0303 protein J2I48_08360 n=1 Tax=Fibrella aquatilis TaxID=2817059 RepID=A0A939JZJ3_9BACT|nr:heme-degrading domain-containing protein [Fibrella aquatilis]MBO0931001.1 heme-degrading domain-containing protein [Fibrella aquatilis]
MDAQQNHTDDLTRITFQEERLQFDTFTPETAWQLGMRLKAAVEALGKAVAIDIQLVNQPLFFFAMPGTTPDNVDWIRRKRNVVHRYHRSSYAIGLELKQTQTTLQDRPWLDVQDHAAAGGCFPVWLRGTGFIGTITISGLPQRQDHNIVVAVLCDWFGVPASELALTD